MVPVLAYLDNLEIGLCLRVNRLGRTEAVRRFFAVVSRLGDWSFWVAMGTWLWALKGNDAVAPLAHIGLTAVIGIGIYKLLKQHLVRQRPFVADGAIVCGAAPLDEYSFPSGHTLHAVALTVMLSHVEPALLAVCAPFAALVAASRVILGLHYPSDVAVGAALGALLAHLSLTWL